MDEEEKISREQAMQSAAIRARREAGTLPPNHPLRKFKPPKDDDGGREREVLTEQEWRELRRQEGDKARAAFKLALLNARLQAAKEVAERGPPDKAEQLARFKAGAALRTKRERERGGYER